MAVFIGSVKSWSEYIKPFLKKWENKSNKLFLEFDKEIKTKKGILTTADYNKLWDKKYKLRFENMQKKQQDEYKKVWLKFHNK